MGATTNEFPLLNAVGLYVKDTAGNGNCLFNALSDQIFGDQSKHGELRSGVIKHMRDNAAYYKQFIDVHPGGGSRRNPKRKNAGTFSTSFNNSTPTQAEIDRKFEGHLQDMARGGTYGDNMEISAFSQAFHVDVKIYQRDFAYVVSTKPQGTTVPVVHIAYHVWEHFSSVRNVQGPHTGPPKIEVDSVSNEHEKSPHEPLTDAPYALPWMVDDVVRSIPYLRANRSTIQKALEENKGNVNNAVSKLLEADEHSSTSSVRGSSSVERDLDSDDEEPIRGPNKRQDRRLSRAARIAVEENTERHNHDLTFRLKGSPLPPTQEHSSPLKSVAGHIIKSMPVDSEEEEWRTGSPSKDSESASVSTSVSDFSSAGKPRSGAVVRLKLSQPKKDSDHGDTLSSSPDEPAAVTERPGDGQRSKGDRQEVPPKLRRLTQRNKRDIKKLAQKTAAKERKKSTAIGAKTLPLKMKQGKENAPVIQAHIRVLYI